MSKIDKLLFLVLLFTAVFLRLYHLDQLPSSLNWMKLVMATMPIAYFKQAKINGCLLATFQFSSLWWLPHRPEYYLTIPFIAIFGLNQFSIRLPSAIAGIALVALSYFLSYRLTKNKNLSYLVMFFTALCPWTLFPSRAVFQSTVAQAFFAAALLFFVSKKPSFALLFLSISMYAYHSTRIIALPVFLVYIFLFPPKLKIPPFPDC